MIALCVLALGHSFSLGVSLSGEGFIHTCHYYLVPLLFNVNEASKKESLISLFSSRSIVVTGRIDSESDALSSFRNEDIS